jgi:serine/threonine protein kinase
MGAADQVRVLAGRYRLDSVIGRGGMGVVWQSRDQLLNRDVAVKEIVWATHLDDEEQESARRSAIREAQAAARLSHPNVVGIYDVINEGGRPWIVMEYLPYPSLRDIISEDGPLAPGEAAHVGLGILAALEAAHSQGVLHRDVKPGNVLVGPDGNAVLTDFGIARVADSQVTTASVILGSPSYISPERARAEKAGPPGDLWGLGATLYAAVEGKPPFERGSALATLTAVVMDDPEPSRKAGPLWPAISGMLRKDPAKRLDGAEVGWMLARVAVGPKVPPTVPFAISSAGPPADSRPAPEPAASPEPAAPPAGLVPPQSERSKAEHAKQEQERAEPITAVRVLEEPLVPEPAASAMPEPAVPEPSVSPEPAAPAAVSPGAVSPAAAGTRHRSWPAVAIAVAAAVVAIGAACAIGILAAQLITGHGMSLFR